VLGHKNEWEPMTLDWQNGEYGDLIVQQWQVEHFEKLGLLKEKMRIDMSEPTTAPGGRGSVMYRLWKDYK